MIASSFINGAISASVVLILGYVIYMSVTEAKSRRQVNQRTARMSVSKASVRRVTECESEDGVFSPRNIIDPIMRKSYDHE